MEKFQGEKYGFKIKHNSSYLKEIKKPEVLSSPFSQKAESEAEEIRLKYMYGFPEKIMGSRSVVYGETIDPQGTNSFDSAISVNFGKKCEVSVHYPDIASIIPFNSALNTEANLRTCSLDNSRTSKLFYPKILSVGLLSLNPDMWRPTVTVKTVLDENLNPSNPEIYLSKFKNRKAYYYPEVDRILKDGKNPEHKKFINYYDLATRLLSKRRSEESALEMDDLKIEMVKGVYNLPIKDGNQELFYTNIIIQEIMTLANKQVADYLVDKGVPALYRYQEGDLNKRSDLLAEINENIKNPDPEKFKLLVDDMDDYLCKGRYSPVPKYHYSLNRKRHLKISSPAHYGADKINLEILSSVIRGEKSPYSFYELSLISNSLNLKKKK